MTWSEEFDAIVRNAATDTSDFDAGLDDWSAANFEPPEPERPEQDDSRLAPPFDITDVDLLSPPGFVGDVAAWIDSQCRYPRRRLAVASAIVSVGNIGGLSHEDARDGMGANMMAFCVAASATGKEAVQQAMAELHRATGLHRAMVGMIKSTKEILENLVEHQPSYFIVDEFGIFLQKVKNAKKRGGSPHLEEVDGTIMSVYSKSNGYYILGGREKRELRKQYAAQAARATDDGEEDASAMRMLKMVDDGLERPFLSLVGYTTPITFEGLMDAESATNGFIGRAILVTEKDIHPSMRDDYNKNGIPAGMRMKLMQIYHGGAFSLDEAEGVRIENYGPRTKVVTTPEADQMLDDVQKWFHKYGEEHMENTGDSSLAMIRRSFEQVLKISFILGIPSRERTADHVRWAFAYVRQELDAKIGLVFANDSGKHRPEESMAARIVSYIDPDKGTSTSVIANRMKMQQEQIEPILERMRSAGMVMLESGKRKYKGKPVQVWRIKE